MTDQQTKMLLDYLVAHYPDKEFIGIAGRRQEGSFLYVYAYVPSDDGLAQDIESFPLTVESFLIWVHGRILDMDDRLKTLEGDLK